MIILSSKWHGYRLVCVIPCKNFRPVANLFSSHSETVRGGHQEVIWEAACSFCGTFGTNQAFSMVQISVGSPVWTKAEVCKIVTKKQRWFKSTPADYCGIEQW